MGANTLLLQTVVMPKRSKKQSSLLGYFPSSSPSRSASEQKPKRNTRAKPSKPSPRKPQTRSRKQKHQTPEQDSDSSESSDVGRINFEPEVVSLSDSDDDVKKSPCRPPAKKRRVKASESSSHSSTARSSESDEENIGIPVGWKGKGKAKAVEKRKLAIQDSESESEEEPQPKRRKLVRGVRPATTSDESEDLMDEVDQERELLCNINILILV